MITIQSMAAFVVHSVIGSPFGRAILMTLIEKSASYRLTPVDPRTLRSPEHLRHHPFGRVPVLEHGDFRLYETQAILRYLDRVLPQPVLTPEDPQAAGRMDQLMNVNDWYLFQGVANVIVFQRLIGPRVAGLTPNEAAIAAAMPKAQRVFEVLAQLLADQPYFGGSTLTLADLLLAPQLDYFSLVPEWEPLTAQRDNLARWLQRMTDRDSMRQTTWERLGAATRPA